MPSGTSGSFVYGIGQQIAFVFETTSRALRMRLRRAGGLTRVIGVFVGAPALVVVCIGILSYALDGARDGAEAPETAARPDASGMEMVETADETADAPVRPGEDAIWAEAPVLLKPGEGLRVLGAADERRYRQIFTLQRDGGFRLAARIAEKLEDRSLMGHVLADRYLRQKRPPYRPLREWLANNRAHPDATRLYETAIRIKPKRTKAPRKPLVEHDSLLGEPLPSSPHWSARNNTRKQRQRVRHLQKSFRIWLSRGEVDKAERMIRRREVLRLYDQYELDEARVQLASALYHKGSHKKAYKYAIKAIGRSAKHHPIAYWTAGLSAWRLGKVGQAAGHFRSLARREDVSMWSRAGGAYWAARAYGKLGKERQRRVWLNEAAGYSATIYGQLALVELGAETRFGTLAPRPTEKVLAPLMRLDQGRRAMALLQVGQVRRAEHELLGLRKWRSAGVPRALFSLGAHAGMPAIGVKLAKRLPDNELSAPGRGQVEAAYFPIPPWRTLERSRIDRALVYAVMRQESSFFPLARSPVGAKGLMQIMPQTAKDLSTFSRFRKQRPLDRYDPATSVALGQTYLEQIMRQRGIGTDLILAIAAYNAGLGNVRHWKKRMDRHMDPLLFVESLPSLETRLFVRRVLTNYWIYRLRLGQDRPTLDQMVKGEFPKYHRLDDNDPPLIGRVRMIEGAPSARSGPGPAG